MIKIGCGTVCFRKLPLDEAMQRIARAGYQYVEPQATAPFCPHVDPWKDDPAKFRRRVAELGFQGASALWAPNGAIIRDAGSVAGVSQAIRWAEAAGIPVVNAGDGNKPEGMSEEEALARLGDRLGQILEVAERCRVHLAIEPHGTFSLTVEGLKKILALSKSPWLGINYDAANVRRATYVETVAGAYSWTPFGQCQDEVATLSAVVERVVHFHAKDLQGQQCVALGTGVVDNRSCIAVLRQRGYDGVLSLETEGEQDPDEGQRLVQASREYLVNVLQELS
jgi:inosose dehydratase